MGEEEAKCKGILDFLRCPMEGKTPMCTFLGACSGRSSGGPDALALFIRSRTAWRACGQRVRDAVGGGPVARTCGASRHSIHGHSYTCNTASIDASRSDQQ